MPPGHGRTPSQIISELLTSHPEAASLQGEARHCQALARISAANVSQAFAAEQAARLSYEELRHRLDPRRRRTADFGAGLLAVVLIGAGLALLDYLELGGLLGRKDSVIPALAATVVWLTGGWLAALPTRERRWPLVLAAATAGVLFGLALAVMHGTGLASLLFGILLGIFILALACGATALMARMEFATLFMARRRWHQARAAYDAAVRTEQDDAEAAAVASQAWLGLVRNRANALADDEHLVRQTVALAVALLESGHPQLSSPLRARTAYSPRTRSPVNAARRKSVLMSPGIHLGFDMKCHFVKH